MSDLQQKCLLILSCSKSKRSDDRLLPAMERYDGPAFRVLRRFLKQPHQIDLDIYVLSANFGLISSHKLIPNYDYKLTKSIAAKLTSDVVRELKSIVQINKYDKSLICVTRQYFSMLHGYEEVLPNNLDVKVATGTLGKKLSILRYWLYGEPSQVGKPSTQTSKKRGKATLKGIELSLDNVDLPALVNQALEQGDGKPYNYQIWYVLIDGKKISPKWLVSQLTGLSVSSFHSQAARRVLQELGIKVYSELQENG